MGKVIGKKEFEVKALITAAGMGKRFGVLTEQTNKCLLRIDGEPILIHLLNRFKEAGLREVIIATGHQHRQVEKVLAGGATIAYNPFYQVSGILGSFWAARHRLEGEAFLFTTADHFFHPTVLADCLKRKADIVVVVQIKKRYTREDAKVIIRGERVVRMGKDIPSEASHGEFGGMSYFSPKASALFFRELQLTFECGNLNAYMMDVLSSISQKYSVPIRYSLCSEESRIEIDSVQDLVKARRFAKKFREIECDLFPSPAREYWVSPLPLGEG